MNACCCTSIPCGAALAAPKPSLLQRWWSLLLRHPAQLAGIRELDPRMLRDIGWCGEAPAGRPEAGSRRHLDFL